MRRFAVFVGRRVAAGVATWLALILLTFVLYWALPATPAFILYPTRDHLTDYQIAHANQLFGLDRPKIVQYGDFLWRLAHGDIGRAWNGSVLVHNDRLVQQPLGPVVYPALRQTLAIIIGGAALVLLLAIPLGSLAGTRIGSRVDRLISTSTLVGICTHPMVLGNLLFLYVGIEWRWIPVGGYCPIHRSATDFCGGPTQWASHLVLPWLTFALIFLALYTRMIRASVSDTLHEDFVRTARAKGAGELRVLRSHVLPSAGLRVLTMVGMEIGTAVGVCIYVEYAFGIHGIASDAVNAMGGATSQIDLPYTLAIVTLISAIVLIGNLVVDLLYAVLDPRTTRETRRTKSVVAGVF
ncbi:MAG TPA: ABC transporter permease [Gaiellaceae bacterium]